MFRNVVLSCQIVLQVANYGLPSIGYCWRKQHLADCWNENSALPKGYHSFIRLQIIYIGISSEQGLITLIIHVLVSSFLDYCNATISLKDSLEPAYTAVTAFFERSTVEYFFQMNAIQDSTRINFPNISLSKCFFCMICLLMHLTTVTLVSIRIKT